MTNDKKQPGSGLIDAATLTNYRLVNRLAESERQHRELLNELPDVVVRLNGEGQITFINQAWHHRFGHDPDEAIGQTLSSFIHAEDRAEFHALFASTDTAPLSSQRLRLHNASGEVHIIHARLRRIDGAEPIVTLEDITAQHQLEAERLRAQRLESLGRFAGGLAHDFNNLLAVVVGNIELVQMDLEMDSAPSPELEHALKACQQATRIANQMLTFSKGGAPTRRPEALEHLLRDAFELYTRGANITWELKTNDTKGLAEIDASQIHQVFHNLILNSIDAMPDGGHMLATLSNTTTADGRPGLLITIEDQGHGIPDDKLDDIFEPYFTTKDHGSGLGLSSAYGIIHRHGGTIEVESEVGVGTVFKITLERCSDTHHAAPAQPNESWPSKRAKVLVMDDDDDVRKVIVAMLESFGHTVVQTRHGRECVDAFQAELPRHPFDLVLLDLTIVGGHDGLWTLDQLSKIEHEVKALVVSGYNNAPVISNPQHYGFIGAVPKPITLTQLKSSVERALNTHHSLKVG